MSGRSTSSSTSVGRKAGAFSNAGTGLGDAHFRPQMLQPHYGRARNIGLIFKQQHAMTSRRVSVSQRVKFRLPSRTVGPTGHGKTRASAAEGAPEMVGFHG